MSTLFNSIFYGLGYTVSLSILVLGAYFRIFKLYFRLVPFLYFLFLATSLLVIIYNSRDGSLFLRLFMIFLALFFAKSIRHSLCFDSKLVSFYFIVIGVITSFIGLKQFFIDYSGLEYYFLSFNDSMQEENLDQNIKRGLGIYFDPLSQGTAIGFAIHSVIYLRDSFRLNKFKFYLLISFFFVSILITLSRASIVGLLLSFIVYLNPSKIKYILYTFISQIFFLISFLILSIIITNDFSDIQNLLDSILSIGQIVNLDVDVGSRFSSSGSLGSRLDGINSVISNFYDFDALNKVNRYHSARDLGYFSIPVLYGPFFTVLILLFITYIGIKIFFRSFRLGGFSHYSYTMAFFILCQSIVTFQLDSFSNVFALTFFLTNQQNNYVTLVSK